MIPKGRRDVLSPEAGRRCTAVASRAARLDAARAVRVLQRGDGGVTADRPRDCLEDR
jgi:hypothetical protein